jgi:hypothetical protein
LGDSSNNIWYSTFDGNEWTPNVTIPNHSSFDSPALAVYGDVLHMVHVGDSSNQLWDSFLSDSTWSSDISLDAANYAATSAPALAPLGDRLHMVYIGAPTEVGETVTEDVLFTSFDGTNWTFPIPLEGNQSKVHPALATYQTQVYMLHLGPTQ